MLQKEPTQLLNDLEENVQTQPIDVQTQSREMLILEGGGK